MLRPLYWPSINDVSSMRNEDEAVKMKIKMKMLEQESCRCDSHTPLSKSLNKDGGLVAAGCWLVVLANGNTKKDVSRVRT